ncbi:MAG: PstS family phosphate ABC transporter substrate-binding protein [Pirellulales bacterium]|nr:PstS family phosphate ABC transporter substrate-binding protein [Pirellulales bacterium]
MLARYAAGAWRRMLSHSRDGVAAAFMMATTPHSAIYTLASLAIVAALGCGKTNVVSVDGSSTVFLISAAVAEKFNEASPKVKVVVSQSGTGGGFKKLAAGEIDVCGASRKITDAEAEACHAAGVEIVPLTVAFDGLAVVANPANGWCNVLTVDQLKTIWRAESAGAVTKWSDVNPEWPDVELSLYGPGDDSGTFDYFTQVINGREKSGRRDYSASENDNALVTGVSGDNGALGYFGLGYYAENQEKLKLIAVDAGDGPKLPSPETVRDGSYRPLSRSLYVYVRRSSLANPGVVAFLKYYLQEAASVAPAVGYVPVTDEIARQSREALAEALSAVKPPPAASAATSDAPAGPDEQMRSSGPIPLFREAGQAGRSTYAHWPCRAAWRQRGTSPPYPVATLSRSDDFGGCTVILNSAVFRIPSRVSRALRHHLHQEAQT